MEKRTANPAPHVDFKGFDDFIEIFEGGLQTDSNGNTREFTDAELDSVVANHDPQHPAPIVIGHPKDDAPSYGWSAALKRDGKRLLAKFSQVEPQFEQMVKDGRFRNRSVRLLPTDNGFKLDHVGWLGAAAPAIAGLQPVAFASVDDGAVYEFSFRDARRASLLARGWRRMRDFVLEHYGADAAERAVPEDSIADWEQMATSEEVDAVVDLHADDNPTYTAARGGADPDKEEPAVAKDQTFTQADIDAAKAAAKKEAQDAASTEFSALQKKHAALEYERRLDKHKAEIDKAIEAGRLTPAQAAGCAEFMASLPAGDEARFEFSRAPAEGEDKGETVKRDPAAWFTEFMKSLPQQVAVGKRLTCADAPDATHAFSAQPGADPERSRLHQKALEYQREHPKTPYVDAVKAVDPNA